MRITFTLLIERMHMPSSRAVASVAAVALLGLAAVASTATRSTSAAEPAAAAYSAPFAQASGGGVTATITPSIVNVRLVRAQAALDRATTWIDVGQSANAVPEFATVQANMTAAWTAAQYVIETTPPPVAAAGAFGHISGGAVVGTSPFASPQDTAMAVFNLDHTVFTTAAGLVDTVDPTVLPNLRKLARAALKARNTAITYIHSIPAPPAAARPKAKTSGTAPVAGDWSAVMPNLIPFLDDEIQQLTGTAALNPTLPATTLKMLNGWKNSVTRTENAVNAYWPPVPAAG
jgi:hypothetical protein